MSKDTVKDFCEHHSIKLLDKNKRAHRYHKINLNYFRNPEDFNMVQQELVDMFEPLYTVEIAESELQKIADFESQVFNNLKQHGHYSIFEYLMEQKEREKQLRAKCPALQTAYEHYSLILKFAESGEL